MEGWLESWRLPSWSATRMLGATSRFFFFSICRSFGIQLDTPFFSPAWRGVLCFNVQSLMNVKRPIRSDHNSLFHVLGCTPAVPRPVGLNDYNYYKLVRSHLPLQC